MNDLIKWLASATARGRRKSIGGRGCRRDGKSVADLARRFREDELMAEYGAGTWVPADKIDPAANVANRLYRTEGGAVRRAYAAGVERERIAAWYFPE